jgi:hypothetical protein
VLTTNQPVHTGDTVFDHLSTAVAHIQSAQFYVTQSDRHAVSRWLDEAARDLEAARTALFADARELHRHPDVTSELSERDA